MRDQLAVFVLAVTWEPLQQMMAGVMVQRFILPEPDAILSCLAGRSRRPLNLVVGPWQPENFRKKTPQPLP